MPVCCRAVDVLQGGKEVADKQRASVLRWFLLGLPWASVGEMPGATELQSQTKHTGPVQSVPLMYSPECAAGICRAAQNGQFM